MKKYWLNYDKLIDSQENIKEIVLGYYMLSSHPKKETK